MRLQPTLYGAGTNVAPGHQSHRHRRARRGNYFNYYWPDTETPRQIHRRRVRGTTQSKKCPAPTTSPCSTRARNTPTEASTSSPRTTASKRRASTSKAPRSKCGPKGLERIRRPERRHERLHHADRVARRHAPRCRPLDRRQRHADGTRLDLRRARRDARTRRRPAISRPNQTPRCSASTSR